MRGHPAVCCLGLHLRDAPACRGRYECARALLRAGADPNYINAGHDLTVFWAIDGGVDMTRLLHEYAPTCSASCHPLELIEAQAGTAAFCIQCLCLTAAAASSYCSSRSRHSSSCSPALGRYGADLDARTPKGWTPLSYAVAKGKYGATEEKGIYPEVRPLCAQKWVNNYSCKRAKYAMEFRT